MVAKNLKIVVCTTLRDFRGNENDKIQHLFLESLEKQSYRNFDLVISLFGETHVKEEVKRYNINSFFYDNLKGDDYRYSHSYVLLNAINHAEKRYEKEKYVILWTTCDVIYPSDFFENIVNSYKENFIGTSNPHKVYNSLLEYEKKTTKIRLSPNNGFDLIFFDKTFLSNKEIISSIRNFIYKDWGVFEHFLIALTELNKSAEKINLYPKCIVEKIENNRKLTLESKEFLYKSHEKNSRVFMEFLNKYNIKGDYFDLVFCFLKFLPRERKLNYIRGFEFQILRYYLKYLIRSFKSKIKNIIIRRT